MHIEFKESSRNSVAMIVLFYSFVLASFHSLFIGIDWLLEGWKPEFKINREALTAPQFLLLLLRIFFYILDRKLFFLVLVFVLIGE